MAKHTAQVQGHVAFTPFAMNHTAEGQSFFKIIRDHDNDMKRVHNAIEDTMRRLDDFYNDEYVPRGCHLKKK